MDQPRPFFARVPLAAWLIALVAGFAHLAPLWLASAASPAGYEFTGNLGTSPDVMQYRVWERRTEFTGPITDNRFTTEPHRAYLPVFFYWGVGALARLSGARPEFVYEWLGAPLAFVLALLLFLCARRFVPSPRATWWVFLATLLGGGLGAHLKLAVDRHLLGADLERRLEAWMDSAPVWEAYRSHFACKVLFDTHFLVAWVFTILALLAFYFAAQRASPLRVALAAAASVLVTVLHPYEGPLLVLVHGATLVLARFRGLLTRDLGVAGVVSTLATAGALGWLLSLQQRSGIPIPDWAPPDVLALNVLLAYPLVALLALFGLAAYWRRAQLSEVFLLGWAAACLAMTLSGPYYRYADRGPTTAQLPLFLIAGGIYFHQRARVRLSHALLAFLVLGAAPLRDAHHRWRTSRFDPYRPAVFLSSERRELLDQLQRAADEHSVLLAPQREYRWLSPEFPGISYDGHFFLTADFERKQVQTEAFFDSFDLARRALLLDERGVDFLYVPLASKPESFAALPGWRALATAERGVLYEREAHVSRH